MPRSRRDFSNIDEGLDDVQQRSNETRDEKPFGGKAFKDFFDDQVCKELEVQFWRPDAGDHLVDIIPFFAGEQYPTMTGTQRTGIGDGDSTYLLDVWVHKNIGPENQQYVCLSKSYGKKCPVCEKIRSLIQESDGIDEDLKKVLKHLNPSRRSVYNVIVRDEGEEEEKGVQVWEVPHFFFEKHVSHLAQNPRTGGRISYSKVKGGKAVAFTIEKPSKNKTNFLGFQFVEREWEIEIEDLESTFVLDELIVVPTYDEVYEALNEGSPAGEEEYEASAGRRRKPLRTKRRQRISEEPEEMDEYPQEEEEPAPSRRRSRPAKTEEEAPPKRRRRKPSSETEEEEAPPKRQMRRKPKKEKDPNNPCPAGHTFGADIDTKKECEGCKVWDECAEEADRLDGFDD